MGQRVASISLLFPFSLAAPLSFTTGSGFLFLFSLLPLRSRLLYLQKLSIHKLTASLLYFWDFWQKLAKTKIVARVNVKTIKAKNTKKALKSTVKKQRRFFTKICWYAMNKNNFLMPAWISLGPFFTKKYNFNATLWRYFAGKIFWHKKCKKLTAIFRASIKVLELFFLVMSPNDILKNLS